MITTEDLRDLIIKILEDKKSENIIEIDLGDKSSIAKYLIIASGRSIKNTSAIADHLSLELKHKAKIDVLLDGVNTGQWVVIDAGSIMVHLFHPETRKIIKLEELWSKI